jgi:Universal stress protein family
MEEEQSMFKSILIPVLSEFYPPAVFQISARLVKIFHSTITSIYITEKKTLDEVERLSDTHLSLLDEEEITQEIRHEHLKQAEHIIFEDAKAFFKKRDIELQTKCVEEAFDEVIKHELQQHHYDLVVIGYEKQSSIDYRLLDELDVSVWVETGVESDVILAICSNLASNKKVPLLSQQLSSSLAKNLQMIYVVDLSDPVQVDEKGKRSEKISKDALVENGRQFIDEMQKKGVSAQLVIGTLEKEIMKASKKMKPMLVIIGREQKVKKSLGFPIKNIKRKLVQHSKHSFLFLN